MKKLLILLSVTMMLSVSIFSLVACGESEHVHDFTNGDCVCGEKKGSDGLQYVLSDEGEYYILTGRGSCSDIDIVVPSEYKGKPVKEIKASSFSGDILRSITISNSIISIENSAFWNCDSLKSVEIGDSVTSIGSYAFKNCSSLKSIEIPDSVTSIGNEAFRNCTQLKSVEIPDSVTSIGAWAFCYCFKLRSITFNGTVEEWKAIEKGSSWSKRVPAIYVKCSNGKVDIY